MLKKKTAVFIDHESWFYGMKNYGLAPDVDSVLGEIESENEVVLRGAFGNISDVNGLSDIEREKLSKFGYELTYTYEGISKEDLTDFVVVDTIYRAMFGREDIEKFIILSGDSHYITVVRTLAEFGKEVEVWAVAGTLSAMYDSFTTRVIYPDYDAEMTSRILDELVIVDALGGAMTTPMCAKKVSMKYGYTYEAVRNQLFILSVRGMVVEQTYLNVRGKHVVRLAKNDKKLETVGYRNIL